MVHLATSASHGPLLICLPLGRCNTLLAMPLSASHARRLSATEASEGGKAASLVCTDVVITATADGSTARAHRGVLATYSSVFRNALAPDLPGSVSVGEASHDAHGHFRLPLPNKSRHELSLLMGYLYPCDSRHEQFSRENIVAFINLAVEYDMPLMKGAAERWLLNELQHGRVVHMTPLLLSDLSPTRISNDAVVRSLLEGGPLSAMCRIHDVRDYEATLTVQLLQRAHTCNLRTFLAKAIEHLTYASHEDLLQMLDAPGAEALPTAVLHRLLHAREQRARRSQ